MNNENLKTSSIMACPNCGMNNVSTANLCIKCGSPLHNQNIPTNNEMMNQMNSNNMNQQSQFVDQSNNQFNMNNNQFVNQNNNQFNGMNNNQFVNQNNNQFNDMNNTQFNQNNNQFNNQTNNQFNNQTNNQMNNLNNNQTTIQSNTGNMNYFKYIINSFLKPYVAFKEEENNLSNFKNSGILTGIIVVALTILNLISTMINTVRVYSFWDDKYEWVWENLKYIEYIKTIGQSLLTYAAIIFAISGVYFLASLVIKKQINFSKLLGATATAIIPLAIASVILGPLLSLISTTLELIVIVVGVIYSIVILLELFNDIIVIENKNTRIYFHLICLSILIVGGGYIAYKILLESLTSSLDYFY